MGTELLLTSLFILLVLGLFVGVVYSMFIMLLDARTPDALAQETSGQHRLLTASILNMVTQLEE